jgi:hypothetical protein
MDFPVCSLVWLRVKIDFFSLGFGVFIGQVAVHLADQDAPVLVSNPSGNGHGVNSAHHANADEMATAIVEAKTWQVGRGPGQLQAFSKRLCRPVLIPAPG